MLLTCSDVTASQLSRPSRFHTKHRFDFSKHNKMLDLKYPNPELSLPSMVCYQQTQLAMKKTTRHSQANWLAGFKYHTYLWDFLTTLWEDNEGSRRDGRKSLKLVIAQLSTCGPPLLTFPAETQVIALQHQIKKNSGNCCQKVLLASEALAWDLLAQFFVKWMVPVK